ncbi:MAG: hypothetical protein K0Q58_135, partial [Microbacterium sp.]|nr:hypothetical protein [Microbacterium sp.]
MSGRDEDTSTDRPRLTSQGTGADMRIGPVRWNGLTSGGAR